MCYSPSADGLIYVLTYVSMFLCGKVRLMVNFVSKAKRDNQQNWKQIDNIVNYILF